MSKHRYAIIGAAGYVAPRHVRAIKETGGELVAVTDPHDTVGYLDSYFRDVSYFREIERFDRHLEKLKRAGEGVDYVVVCTPNYLHDAHCRLGLRLGREVICEKPLTIHSENCLALTHSEYNDRIHPCCS